jgi:hypothetical protein
VRRPALLGSRELCRGLLAACPLGGSLQQQQLPLLALGHCHPEHYTALLEELPALAEEAAKPQRKGRARPEEVRPLRLCVWGGEAAGRLWPVACGLWPLGRLWGGSGQLHAAAAKWVSG